MRLLRTIGLLVTFLACDPHKGAVDTTTGLQGITVPDGSLAGSWALIVEFGTIVGAGILGDQAGGFREHLLVERTWDAAARSYLDTVRRCGRDAFEVAGTRTLVPTGTWAKLLPYTGTSSADHATGSWNSGVLVELWGVRNLPEPLDTPLPTQGNYQQPPQQDWVFDEDEDGQAAVTELSHGAVTGSMLEVERTGYQLAGTITDADHLSGVATLLTNSSNRLQATSSWLLGESSSRPDPDRVSWFDSARLGPQATCDDVAAAVAQGAVSTSKPF